MLARMCLHACDSAIYCALCANIIVYTCIHAHTSVTRQSKYTTAYNCTSHSSHHALVSHQVDWVLENGLRGMMFWALDMDDFTGQMCDDGKYPLLKALSRSVDLVEAVELTKNVNRNIRYLTMYVGAGCGLRGGNLGLGLGLFLAVIAVVLR